MTFKISETELADESISREHARGSGQATRIYSDFTAIYIVCSILIFSFNIVGTLIALISIGNKGYDPYIHLSAMLTSVLTLGCIAAIYKFIIKE